MFYRLKHVSPGGAEDAGHFLPGQMLGPAGQEPAVAGRQVTFSPAHGTRSTVTPQPGSSPAAWHTRSTRRSPTTARTRNAAPAGGRSPVSGDRSPSRSPAHSCGHGPPLRCVGRPAVFHPFGFSVHKGLERFDPIEDSLQLHPVVAPGEMGCFANPSLPENLTGCTCFPASSFRYTAPVWRNGVGLCWRATRQGITRPGRVNDPLAPAASAARAFSSPHLLIHLPCHASENARQPLTNPVFTHKILTTIQNKIPTPPSSKISDDDIFDILNKPSQTHSDNAYDPVKQPPILSENAARTSKPPVSSFNSYAV